VCRAKLPPGSETLYEEVGRRYFIFLRRHQQKKALSATDKDEMKELLRLARTAADFGGDRSCGQAKMLLGSIYLQGRWIALHDDKVFEWHHKAAKQGFDYSLRLSLKPRRCFSKV
jgi:TPR repeat protein